MASWEKKSERLLKARYRFLETAAWNYPPAYTGADTRAYEFDGLSPSSFNNTIPVTRVDIASVSANPLRKYIDSFEDATLYGLKYEIDADIFRLEIGNTEDETMFEFLERFHNAPFKEIGYIHGLFERLTDQNSPGLAYDNTGGFSFGGGSSFPATLAIKVVSSQEEFDASHDSHYRHVRLHLRSANLIPLASVAKYYYTGS